MSVNSDICMPRGRAGPRVFACLSTVALFAGAGAAAQAAVVISTDATQNMTCSNGACAPTSSDAVLNVGDLQNLLASGSVEVTTTGSGVQASDILVELALSWSTSNVLALDASQSITINAPVSIMGLSGLALTTNDGGQNGTLSFGPKGNATFADLSSSLTINGASYLLANSIQSLASAVATNPSGNFALANSYNAKLDGTYATVPIPTTLTGTLEGLGNAISHLKIKDAVDIYVGLFSEVGTGASVRDVTLANANIVTFDGTDVSMGALAGLNGGTIFGCRASGSLTGKKRPRNFGENAGGLVGLNILGLISHSSATASVVVEGASEGAGVGGLVAINTGTIEYSYARGNVTAAGKQALIGGLVGVHFSPGSISIVYATGSVTGGESAFAGGLVGHVDDGQNGQSQIDNSYATGAVSVGAGKRHRGLYSYAGGLIGGANYPSALSNSYSTGSATPGDFDSFAGGSIGGNSATVSDVYWDTTTSGTDIGVGTGSDHGVTGLTTNQLKSGLPAGFDPSVWGQQKGINNGLPYLLAIPPKK